MKKCFICGETKPKSDFYKNAKHRDGLQSRCKKCKQIANKQYYLDDREGYIKKAKEFKQKRRNSLREIKATFGCRFCGEKEPYCLDFHHPNNNKELTIGRTTDIAWSKIKKEIDKCIVVCKNCHAKIHCGILRV